MESLRTRIKGEVDQGSRGAVDVVIDAILATHVLIEKMPAPARSFAVAGWSCDQWNRDGMKQVRANNNKGLDLAMNVEAHWTDLEVEAYVAEQIGLREGKRHG